MKKVVHLITGLNNGGAEMMLYKLLQNSDRQKHQFSVISMMDKGVMGEKIEELGVSVHCLHLNTDKNFPAAIMKTRRLCKDSDIIQTWMYHANLWGFLATILLKKKIIWGIRRGVLVPSVDKNTTILIAKVGAKLSGRVDSIVYCADNSRSFHEQDYQYVGKHALVIPNGFELEKFKRDREAGEHFRINNGIRKDTTVIAFIGRYHAVKGFDNLCKALKILNEAKNTNYIVLFAGTGATDDNSDLRDLILENGLQYSTICLGRRDDIPTILSAADMLVSASYTEAFSNVIGEAMACQVPCVVTDVGDSAYIVGDTGIVVKNNEPEVLAEGIAEMLQKNTNERIELGEKARIRVKQLFDIKMVAKKYEELYV